MLELKVHDGSREIVLQFEHSLRSVSKWESRYKKPFLGKQHTALEMIDYYVEMLLSPPEYASLIYGLSPDQLEAIGNYINDPMTASFVPVEKTTGEKETVTSELVYYWMTELRIPWEAQDWHYNRLSMLIRVMNHKKQPPKKQSIRDFKSRWQSANEANRKRFNSNG